MTVKIKRNDIQQAQQVGSIGLEYESLTVDDTAIELTAATYGTLEKALITVENAPIRFRIDGENPTSEEGHILNSGDTLKLDTNDDIASFKAIRTTNTDADIRVTYSEVG